MENIQHYHYDYEKPMMTNDELAQALGLIVSTAPKGVINLGYLLFGIKYARELSHPGISIARVLTVARLPKSYQAEVSKGESLSPYVTLKEDSLWF